MKSRLLVLGVSLALSAPGAPLAAQGSAPLSSARSPAYPGWLRGWSPLGPLAGTQNSASAAPQALGLLRVPPPRVGLLWSAGSPAGLGTDVRDEWAELQVTTAGEAGPLRGPLDPDGTSVLQLAGLRWQPLGSRGAVIGRVVADITESDVGSRSPSPLRDRADPFVVTDTTAPSMRHLRTRVEGGYGGRWGKWFGGLIAGIEVSDDRTTEARLPRLVRSATPALAIGVGRRVLGDRLLASIDGGWVGGREDLRVVATEAVTGVVHRLEGYSEPQPAVFSNRIYSRQLEERGWKAGASTSGVLSNITWTVFARWEDRTREHRRDIREDAPVDLWEASAWFLGADAGWSPAGNKLRVVARGRYMGRDGEAFRNDLTGAIYRARGTSFRGELDLRYGLGTEPRRWTLAGRATVARRHGVERDFLVEKASNVVEWEPALAAEVSGTLRPGTAVSLGLGVALHRGSGSLPDPESLGSVYRELVAPGLWLRTRDLTPFSLELSVRQRVGPGVQLLAHGGWERSALSSGAGTAALAFPYGDRTRWRASFSLIWNGD